MHLHRTTGQLCLRQGRVAGVVMVQHLTEIALVDCLAAFGAGVEVQRFFDGPAIFRRPMIGLPPVSSSRSRLILTPFASWPRAPASRDRCITSLIAAIEGVDVWSFEANPDTAKLAKRIVDANCGDNVRVLNGMLAAGPPQEFLFYMRPDLWMSSTIADQGPYERVLKITSSDVDAFVRRHRINAMVMDIEGAELDLLQNADLSGIERVFLELHDHLYGLAGVRRISDALASNGLIYDPRGSSGPCVLFSRDDGERHFDAEIAHAV